MNQDWITAALEFAIEKHAGDFRDGDVPLPYISHVIEVANFVRYIGGVTDPEMIAAAFLHDVLEHGGATIEELQVQFSERIVELVGQLTRTEPTNVDHLSKDELRDLRSELLLEDIATRMEPDAKTIKLADRLSNLICALKTRKGEKRKRYLTQTAAILERIPRAVNPALWDAVASTAKQGRASIP